MKRRDFLKHLLALITISGFTRGKILSAKELDKKKILLPNTNKLGFGFMRLPQLDKDDPAKIDMIMLNKMVDLFLEKGFTYFDTAWMYMGFKSEEALKEALVKRHERGTFQVASKLPMAYIKSNEDREKIFNAQLKKCGLDYFDNYLLHNLNTNTYKTVKEFNCFDFIAKKKAEGKIKHIGFSFHDSAELLETILKENPSVEFVQLQINYLDWDSPSIQSRKCYEIARKYKKDIIVMEPIKGGALVNLPKEAETILKSIDPKMSIASWAIRYVASLEGVTKVLSGMSTMEQLQDNISYMQDFKSLNDKELNAIKSVVKILNKSNAIPCTACRYCVSDCPKKIKIPEYFALYNGEIKRDGKGFSIQKLYYENYTKTAGKASDCIGCHMCEKLCPQHIKITEKLKEVAKTFEGKS